MAIIHIYKLNMNFTEIDENKIDRINKNQVVCIESNLFLI